MNSLSDRKRQQGVVLVVGLVLLLAMTLIGVTAMKLTTLDERIAGNAQQRVGLFQASESALMETVDYDKVLSCSHEKCECEPDKNNGAIEKREECLQDGHALSPRYSFAAESGAGGGAIPTIAGMEHIGDVNVYGNSIGVATTVAGRLVRIRSVAGTDGLDNGGRPAAVHDLLVAPVGLRNR